MDKSTILTLHDSKEWSNLIESCQIADIHFMPEYMRLFEKRVGGIATLFVVNDERSKNFLVYPFFKRRINDLVLFSSYDKECYDIISPWYFGGPLFSSEENKSEILNMFLHEFQSFVKENDIVSEFTRIHPIFDMKKEFANITNAEYRYDVAYVNLQETMENIWSNFTKSNKNSINASKRKGVVIEFSTSSIDLKNFSELYMKTMKRISADEFYFFSLDFFERILEYIPSNVIIVTAKYDNIVISSSILLHKSGIVYYWLSGNNYDFRNLYPNNLLIYESIKWAKNLGNKFFILMGGTNKGLRSFKDSFTKDRVEFYSISKIFNTKIFSDLNNLRHLTSSDTNSGFFPAYRQ